MMDSRQNILKSLPTLKHHQTINEYPQLNNRIYIKNDQPLYLGQDATGETFIKCEYNQYKNSHRSPNDNLYYPFLEEVILPSDPLRKLEIKANIVFAEYKKIYYENAYSNCYFWDKDDGGFSCAWLILKNINAPVEGTWQVINIIDVKQEDKYKFRYKLSTTVSWKMNFKDKVVGNIEFQSTQTKQKEEGVLVSDKVDIELFHLEKISQLIEDLECLLRQNQERVYVDKTKQIPARCQRASITQNLIIK
ncbi:hypothetical protein pb186bvf_007711 [Paramecium bursaria]